jgi:sulfopyruvate decarboxylase subunit beta
MRRIEALAAVDAHVGDAPLVVTCGAAARELASLVRRDSHLHLLDSMGLAAAVAAGVALRHPARVTAIEGDGSLLMGVGVLGTLATAGPLNLTLVVLDNAEHASAGRIPSQAAALSLPTVIRGFGLPVREVDDSEALARALRDASAGGRLAVVHVRIEGGNEAGVPFLLEDPAVLAYRFRRSLALTEIANPPADQGARR